MDVFRRAQAVVGSIQFKSCRPIPTVSKISQFLILNAFKDPSGLGIVPCFRIHLIIGTMKGPLFLMGSPVYNFCGRDGFGKIPIRLKSCWHLGGLVREFFLCENPIEDHRGLYIPIEMPMDGFTMEGGNENFIDTSQSEFCWEICRGVCCLKRMG